MRIGRSLRSLLLSAALASVVLVVGAGAAAADPAAPPGTPTSVTFAGVPSVGALFDAGLTNPHTCSASVVRSPGHDLVLTAAHCIAGTGAGLVFAPGYVNGTTPYGVWTVSRAWVAPQWIKSQDPQHDYAFLSVRAQVINGKRVQIQDVTKGSVLGVAPRSGTVVTDIAYPFGLDDQPIRCTAELTYTGRYPTFDCHGYPGGTSGSPFLLERRTGPSVVVGVIGGLHQGGCYEWNSFSSPFDLDTFRTYLRAALNVRPDVVPVAGSDGC